MRTREELLASIRKLGERACLYAGKPWPDRMCDCKYGVESDTSPSERYYCGEQSGCPELGDIFSVLKAMTDDEYAGIEARISAQIAEAWRQYKETHRPSRTRSPLPPQTEATSDHGTRA